MRVLSRRADIRTDVKTAPADIAFAQNTCAAFQPLYRGPNPLTAGTGTEDADECAAAVDEAWNAWSGFARTYFMAMLNTLGGCKPLALESEIVRFCTPAEAIGGRAAMDVFWRRGLALRGSAERRGGVSMTPLQLAILADDAVNAEVFRGVEARMEQAIMNTLRGRRGFLQQIDAETDHAEGLQADIASFFGGGRPAPLPSAQRNENFDFMLF